VDTIVDFESEETEALEAAVEEKNTKYAALV
jgi:hypothetical protein